MDGGTPSPDRGLRLGLGAQLSALSVLVLLVTLFAGGYATYTVRELRDRGDQSDRIQQVNRDELSLDELNEAMRADVIGRSAGVPVTQDMIDDLHELQQLSAKLGSQSDSQISAQATAEAEFAGEAQHLLLGDTPARADVDRFRETAITLSDHVDDEREVLAREQQRIDSADDSFTTRAVLELLSVAVACAAALFAAARVIRRRLIAELRRLAATAQAVAAGDLSARSGRGGNDEVGQLARVLDEASDTLQHAFIEREADARRQAFRAQLDRALAQVDDDLALAETVGRALKIVVPGRPSEMLIADSSESHLHTFATNPGAPAPGCRVSTPWSCPAVRAGRIAQFPSSQDLDACPHLRDRPEGDRSGACIPIGFMGRVLGVLHSSSAAGDLPDAAGMDQLGALAEQTGARLGNLRAFDKIQRQAAVDALTGLPNRRSFEDSVRSLAGRGIRYGVLLADLDHFKVVNDTYGHAAGDRALQLFAEVVHTALRDGDLPCRFGGEEFAIVIPNVDAAGAAEVADRLRMSLAVAVIGSTPTFTVSLGAADSTMAPDLAGQLALADTALLAAKREGRDRCLIADPSQAPIGASVPED